MRLGKRRLLLAALAVPCLLPGVASAQRVVADEAAYVAPRLTAGDELELGVIRDGYSDDGGEWSPASDVVVHTRSGSRLDVPDWAEEFGLTAFGPTGTPTWWTGALNESDDDAVARRTSRLGTTHELLAGRTAVGADATSIALRGVQGPPGSRVAGFAVGRDAPGERPWGVALLYDSAGEMVTSEGDPVPDRWAFEPGEGGGRLGTQMGFSRAGYYCLDFEARTTLSDGRSRYVRQPVSFAVGGVDPQAAPACATAGGTQLALSASTQSASEGDPVTLRATVSPSTATGTVAFEVGGRSLGTAPVRDGRAELTTTQLPPGRNDVRADFTPADPAEPSSSATANVRVQPTGRYVVDTAASERLHTDVGILGGPSGLELSVGVDASDGRHQQIPMDDAVIAVPDRARAAVPADPAYRFLGAAGSPAWTIPVTQVAGIPWLGISAEGLNEDAFRRGPMWRLRAVSDASGGPAPGAVVAWFDVGGARPLFSTRQGLPNALLVPAHHLHVSWAFTAPGVYCLAMDVDSRFAGSGVPTRDARTLTVVVGDAVDAYRTPTCAERGTVPAPASAATPGSAPAGERHSPPSGSRSFYDLRPVVDGDGLRVDVLEGDAAGPGRLRDVDDVVFGTSGLALETAEGGGLTTLGSDTTGLDATRVGDLRWRVVDVTGPGTLTVSDRWHDDRGTSLLSSVAGAAPADYDLWADRRDPLAWRFTAPGVHCATFEWAGETPAGRTLRTRRTLTFAVDVDPAAVTPCARRATSPASSATETDSAAPPAGAAPVPVPATPVPVAPAGRSPLSLSVATDRTVRARSVRRRGALAVRCGLSQAGRCAVRATVSRTTARRLGLRSRIVGTGARTLRRAGSAIVRVRLTSGVRRALRRPRQRVRISLVVTGSAPALGSRTRTLAVTLVRG